MKKRMLTKSKKIDTVIKTPQIMTWAASCDGMLPVNKMRVN